MCYNNFVYANRAYIRGVRIVKSFLTMKYHFKANEKEKKLLKFLCHISKNIYNCALYELRGQYFKEKKKL